MNKPSIKIPAIRIAHEASVGLAKIKQRYEDTGINMYVVQDIILEDLLTLAKYLDASDTEDIEIYPEHVKALTNSYL